jgi:hypothetical protein
MTPQEISKTLKVVGTVFRTIFAPGADRILADAQAQLQSFVEESQRNQRKWRRSGCAWGYRIFPEQPLQFARAPVKKHEIEIDLYCKFAWTSDPEREASEQVLVLRIWSSDDKLKYREEWDAQVIREAMERHGKRVLSRYHFDLANPEQPGPRYHLQVGGVPRGDEYCWHPKQINLPRIIHPPTDLAFGCELVAANFFPEQYRTIRKNPEWRKLILDVQRTVLGGYFERCRNAVSGAQPTQSLLDELWHHPWP